MATVIFEEAVCRKRDDADEKYRLVLPATQGRKGELKSVYRRGETSFAWELPFNDSVTFSNSNSPLRVSIELRKKGWVGMSGQTICSYILVVDRDCQSATFNLRANNSETPSSPELSVTLTVAGLSSASEDSVQVIQNAPVVTISGSDDAENIVSGPSSGRPAPNIESGVSANRSADSSPSLLRPAALGANNQLLSQALSESNDAMRSQSSLDLRAPSIAESNTEAAGPTAEAAAQITWSGVSRIGAVMELVNVAADIHPLVKGVWSLLNLAYTLARQQSDLDIKVGDLVDALDANCELARVLTEDQIGGVAETIVTKILQEVLNGADVIKEYCTKRKSKLSVFKFAGSTTALRVDACLQTLEVFRRDLADHVAANVHRDLHGLQTLVLKLEVDLKAVKAKIDHIDDYVQTQEDKALLDQMPYAPAADRDLRSRERGCLPQTRVEIIDAIVNWAIGAELDSSTSYIPSLKPDSRVLWLCGVAGSGKSSIAISVAKALLSMDRLGALYGFERAFQATLNPTNLFSTIARQRADRQPEQKRLLIQTLQRMKPEMRAITDAAEQFAHFNTPPSSDNVLGVDDVIIIDAFDESGSTASRTAALRALSPEGVTPAFPDHVRFLITSRYDHDVAQRLENVIKGDESIISVVRMEDIRSADTERDIHAYVFRKLQGVAGLETSYATGEITRLAMAAEHSFQWASTACLHISQDDNDALYTPAIRLREIIATRGALNPLYLSILNQHFESSVKRGPSATLPLRAILGGLVCAFEPLSVHAIASLATADSHNLGSASDFRLVARRLSSIVTGTHDEHTPLIPLHTSFTDFLCDPIHSGDYAVASRNVHVMLGPACLTVMKRLLRFNICDLETSFLRNDAVPDLAERVKKHIPDELLYTCRFWPAHVAAALSFDSPETERLRQSLSDFLGNKLLLLEWLEVMSLTGTDAYASLGPLLSLQADNRDLSDLLLFVTYFSIPISLCVPHIYLSALAFTPSSSLIAPTTTRFPNLVRSDKPLPSWPQVRHKLEHSLEVQSVAWSPDGRWLVSGEGKREAYEDDAGGGICVWDVYRGRLVLPRMSTTSTVLSVAVSQDGSLLASGHRDGTVLLWDAHTLAAKGSPLKGHTNFVQSVAFSPTDSLLASGSNDKTVVLWDVITHSLVGDRLEGHRSVVSSVAFSSDGTLLLSASWDETIRLWNISTHSAQGDPLDGHTNSVCCSPFSPDGSLLASGSSDTTVRLWDVRSGTAVGDSLAGHSGTVRSVAFSPDGQTLASSSRDKTVRFWDVDSRSPSGEPVTGHTDSVNSVAFSPNGALLASGSSDKTVHIWDAHVSPLNRESPVTQFKIQNFAAFSRDGKLLASGSNNNAIQLWDVHSVSAVGEPLKGHTNAIRSVAFAPDGILLASGSDDETVRLWDVRTGSAVGEPLTGHSSSIWALAFSPDNKLLASASWDETIRFWDMHARSASGDPLTGHSEPVLSVAFSPDGSTLASGDAGGTVWLWDVRTRSPLGEVLKGHSDWVRCVTFSPDGTLLVSGSDDGTIRIWDVGTHSAVGIGHANNVTSLAFSSDGALLASRSQYNNVVRLWDVRVPPEVGEPLALLRHESNVYSIAFLSAAPILSSITGGGVVREWDLGYLLSASSSNFPRNPEERLKEYTLSRFPDHTDLTALSPDFLVDLDDGWVMGPKNELVLWIPPALRPSVDDIRVKARFGGPPHVKLDFSNFVCGSDWSNCYDPPPPSSAL